MAGPGPYGPWPIWPPGEGAYPFTDPYVDEI